MRMGYFWQIRHAQFLAHSRHAYGNAKSQCAWPWAIFGAITMLFSPCAWQCVIFGAFAMRYFSCAWPCAIFALTMLSILSRAVFFSQKKYNINVHHAHAHERMRMVNSLKTNKALMFSCSSANTMRIRMVKLQRNKEATPLNVLRL